MREIGVLVPKINVVPIRVSSLKSDSEFEHECNRLSRIRLSHKKRPINDIPIEEKRYAESHGYKARDLYVEAASSIIAHLHMLQTHTEAIGLTFSKQVAICEDMNKSLTIREMFGSETQINTVHSNVKSFVRKKTYDAIKNSKNSVLFQHSIIVEGFDLSNFNYAVFHRDMEVITTQQAIGRIIRANPLDTQDLLDGKIELNSPNGWRKYDATIFVVIDDDDKTYHNFVKDFIEKLVTAGFSPNDVQFCDIVKECTSLKKDLPSIFAIANVSYVDVCKQTLSDVMKKTFIDFEEEREFNEELRELKKLSFVEKFKMFK
jgi:superfamily II DNA or RNA helicase